MNRALIVILIVCAGFFIWLCADFDFFQDDAYISFRYIQNYLDGHGLVFNYGERIEGFTNFGWVAFLLAWAVCGVDYLSVARFAGIFFGAMAILFSTLLILRFSKSKNAVVAFLVPPALASCLSLAPRR